MKLEPPLARLIHHCEAICVAECCGLGAYDFSPIHLAAGLIYFRGVPDPGEVLQVREQIDALKTNYGTSARSGGGVTLEDMNQTFSAEEIDRLAEELSKNLEVALCLIEDCERRRYER